MNYLFWNTNKKNINNTLKKLIINFSCDIVALAEYSDDINCLLEDISNEGINLYEVPQIGCDRIHILTKFYPENIKHFNECNYYTIKGIPHENLGYHFIAFVHLPSKMYKNNPLDIIAELQALKGDLERVEGEHKNRKSLILGDFNVNPFEDAMTSALSCHSFSCRDIVRKNKRTVSGREYYMFYNPMWNLFGDINSPPGTYYYNNSSQVNYYWNIFDQVIIRPEIIENFNLKSLKIITDCKDVKLLNKNNIPSVSDHLPIFFSIN